jgi:hypothetical protein
MHPSLLKLAKFCVAWLLAVCCHTAFSAENVSRAGPVITVEVQRGAEKLPISKVDHLRKGDQLWVHAERSGLIQDPWLLVLAVVTPTANLVSTQGFDLKSTERGASIEITDDAQVPVIVLAPQVKTFFGLGTSFQQSADLIAAAIKADPQRFVDLQKIDQIDKTINTLKVGLDTLVQTLKPADAVDATKAMAAKFGAKTIDPDCLKGGTVDTRCVATSIVSNQDLKIPSLQDLGSMAQPFVTNALSPDLLVNVRLVVATSAFLATKYRDQYDLAPSSAQRDGDSGKLRLFTNSKFQSGDLKTAYVYVPSWYAGDQAQLSLPKAPLACIATGRLPVQIAGQLPMGNYWHGWNLSLSAQGSAEPVMKLDALNFSPERGFMDIHFKDKAAELKRHGYLLEASLTGFYAFDAIRRVDFSVALPGSASLKESMIGLNAMIAGDKVRLGFVSEAVSACISGISLRSGKQLTQASRSDIDATQWDLDLKDVAASSSQIEIDQVGGGRQIIPVKVLQRRAYLTRLEHFDLEPVLYASGDNLDRIDHIQVGTGVCLASTEPTPASRASRSFTCPEQWARNADLPSQATLHYLDQEPQPETVPLRLTGPRPLMKIGGGRNALVTVLSANAFKWGLDLNDALVSSDSGLSAQLVSPHGYKLQRGNYTMQLKFVDDPVTESGPITVSLQADYVHNELHTRRPIDFKGSQLPDIVSPLLYRVLHQPSGLASDWKSLERSLIGLPSIGAIECQGTDQNLLLHGNQLDQIDWASNDPTVGASPTDTTGPGFAKLARCADGICLGIRELSEDGRLKVKLRWIDDRIFDLKLASAPRCDHSSK